MSACVVACKLRSNGASTWAGEEVDRGTCHEDIVHGAKVKPLSILRMNVTTRLVVRGRDREPQPQS